RFRLLSFAPLHARAPMDAWISDLNLWLAQHPHWLGLAILLTACLECLAVAGLLVPGTVLLFAICVLAGGGALELWQVLLLGYAGGLRGDLLSYGLGRGSEEHTSELQSHENLECRLLLEKQKAKKR